MARQEEVDRKQEEADRYRKAAEDALQQLDWQPRVTFEELVQMMYENDLKEEQARAAASQR